MSHYFFTVVLQPDSEEPRRYNVRVPLLPGCLTYGESIDDALANAREAIALYVDGLIEDGESVPIEEHPTIATTVVIPAAAVSPADAAEPVGVAAARS